MARIRVKRRDARLAAAALIGAAVGQLAAALRRPRKTRDRTSPAVLGGSPQRRLYAGRDIADAVTIADLRAMAHRRLPRFALEYLEGGAEDEATLACNRAAVAQWGFRRRALIDVSRRGPEARLFGRPTALPLAVAPTGLNGLYWPHADLRLAEAASAAGVPFTLGTMSNDRLERVARVPGLRCWWQLYVFGPPEVRQTLLKRARDAGCEALIVTTDAQIYGNREWDTRAGAAQGIGPRTMLDALRHPRWLAGGPLTHGMPRFANLREFLPCGQHGFFESANWIRSQMDVALSWETIARLRAQWPRRLIVKGLLAVEDVVRAREIGVDAVALSNHGGRQLDWSISPLDILPAAREAAGREMTILVDGGIRRGTDIVKALALGADAVLVGRAVLYGVAASGRAGAERALAILREEIDRDLGLIGAPHVADLGPQLLARQPAQPEPLGLIGSA